MPTPYRHETQNQFMKRCRQNPGMNQVRCRRVWQDHERGKRNMRVIELRENKGKLDLDKIRKVAGNEDLTESQVFDFGSFIIARSGVNRNHTDITAEGQRAAVAGWIGKPIYHRDHETETDNQIGRIYDAWIEDRPGETVTVGRGYGVLTDDHRDIFTRIKNGIHREMSCAYEPVRSVCSDCGEALSGERLMGCPRGHQVGLEGIYARDLEFKPDHISFVGRPAVEGAGLVAAEDQKRMLRVFRELGDEPEASLRELKRDAEDGKAYRAMVQDEFIKWFGMANLDASDTEIKALAAKLSAQEMTRLARIEKDRVHEILPGGGTQRTAMAPEKPEPEQPEPLDFKSIREAMKKG